MSHELKQVLENDQALARALRSLPRRSAPAGMRTSLRVVASLERERAVHRLTWKSRVQNWMDHARLTMQNVMRPLALPVAGGVFSAVTLFSVWVVPAYPAFARTGYDVPTQLSTQARVKGFASTGTAGQDILMDVSLDQSGLVVDYTILADSYMPDADGLRRLENMLVFQTTFIPATSFGQPTASRIRLWLSSSRIDVKG